MKTMSFTVKSSKPRNSVAQAMFDRTGEFKPRSVKKATAFKRRPKHVREAQKDWE